MAANETDVSNRILLRTSKVYGARLMKNVRGMFYTKDSVDRVIAAVKTRKLAMIIEMIKTLRIIRAGLQAPGASDLVGPTPIVVTQEMVGRKIAVMTVFEVKTETGRPSPDQNTFLDAMKAVGAIAGIVRCEADAERLIEDFQKKRT